MTWQNKSIFIFISLLFFSISSMAVSFSIDRKNKSKEVVVPLSFDNQPSKVNIHMNVYDADVEREAELYINGKGPIILFDRSFGGKSNDKKTIDLTLVTEGRFWKNGDNVLRFRRIRSSGFTVNSLKAEVAGSTNPTPDPTPDPEPTPEPNSPPTASADLDSADKADTTYEKLSDGDLKVLDDDGNGSESFSLSAAGSSDSDGTISSYKWLIAGQSYSGMNSPKLKFFLGNTSVSLTVTDNDGASSSISFLVNTYQTSTTPDPEPDPTPDPTPVPSGNYNDDTFNTDSSAPGEVVPSTLSLDSSGNVKSSSYNEYDFYDNPVSGRYVLDIKDSAFLVDNNTHSAEPTQQYDVSKDCNVGSSGINKYPFSVKDNNVTVIGGVFDGYYPNSSNPHVGIPLSADWDWAYCNSAAILFKGADNGHVDGARLTATWDAIRVDDDNVVENTWMTHVRDDIIENDGNKNHVFKDNLADGAFQGISSKGGGTDGSANTTHVLGNVIKIRSYKYKAVERGIDQYYGAFFKYDSNAPRTEIHNTVIAVEPDAEKPGGSINSFSSQWGYSWSKIKNCSNNLFLWLNNSSKHASIDSDVQIDKAKALGCFKIVTGAEAHALYEKAKKNWINCHPKVPRLMTDPASDPNQCQPNEYGGFSYAD